MSSFLLFAFVIGYFLLLLVVAWRTSRHSNNDSFFIGNRNSNWMLVAFGMIGTSLSGVTFVSVPGTVGDFAGSSYKAFVYSEGSGCTLWANLFCHSVDDPFVYVRGRGKNDRLYRHPSNDLYVAGT